MHVKYLGHVVGSGKLSVDRDKVAAVADWQPPTDVKATQQFLRFANYYNLFKSHLATVAVLISNFLSVKGLFMSGEE